MKRNARPLVLFLGILVIVSLLRAQDDEALPRFEDYRVTEHYTGKTAPPIVRTQEEREFRTRLHRAAKQKPNFAGKYVFNAFGCGAECLVGFLLDAKTGKVIWVPFIICCWGDDVARPIEFNLDSSLMIFKGSRNEEGGGTYYYNFDGKKFVLVRSIETGMPAQNHSDHMPKPPTTRDRIVDEIRRSGFPHLQGLIHSFVGGSELHGAKLGATDDLDIYGIYIEPPEQALGLQEFEHFVWSTASNDRRNGPDDVDITLYSLRKWAALAAKGNPTALHFLFAGETPAHPTWQIIETGRPAFLARESAAQFLGFVTAQVQRVTGERGRGKKGQRPEIEEKFGYDTKAAMHSCRLLYECIELMEKGTITLPRPEKELLIQIRGGCWSLDRFLDEINRLSQAAEEAAKASQLPETVDRHAISRLVARAYLHHWKRDAAENV